MIYVISDGHGHCKIGTSTDPTKRIRSIQTGSPFKLAIEATFPGNHERESQLHRHFASSRMAGEWFDLPAADVARMIRDDDLPVIIPTSTAAPMTTRVTAYASELLAHLGDSIRFWNENWWNYHPDDGIWHQVGVSSITACLDQIDDGHDSRTCKHIVARAGTMAATSTRWGPGISCVAIIDGTIDLSSVTDPRLVAHDPEHFARIHVPIRYSDLQNGIVATPVFDDVLGTALHQRDVSPRLLAARCTVVKEWLGVAMLGQAQSMGRALLLHGRHAEIIADLACEMFTSYCAIDPSEMTESNSIKMGRFVDDQLRSYDINIKMFMDSRLKKRARSERFVDVVRCQPIAHLIADDVRRSIHPDFAESVISIRCSDESLPHASPFVVARMYDERHAIQLAWICAGLTALARGSYTEHRAGY